MSSMNAQVFCSEIFYFDIGLFKRRFGVHQEALLRLLRRPRQGPRQEVVGSILRLLDLIRCNKGPPVEFRWVPAHEGIAGNDKAHSLALEATKSNQQAPLSRLLRSSAMARCKEITSRLWRKTFEASKVGESIRKLDRALAHFHTKKLYDQLNYREAVAIAQLDVESDPKRAIIQDQASRFTLVWVRSRKRNR